MSDMKCQHEWKYFDEHDFPNGYEYEQVNIPHKRCKKCGKEYELFDGYGEYAKRWRKVEYWSPELHRLEQELIRTRKALDVAVDALKSAHDYYEYCIQRDKDYGGDDINWDCTAMNMDNDISEALEQITALTKGGDNA